MSIQNKISLLFTAITASILLLLSVTIYLLSARSTFDMFFHRLSVRASIMGHAYLEENENHTAIYFEVKERHLKNLPEENHYIIHIDSLGHLLHHERPDLPLNDAFYQELIEQGRVQWFQSGVFYAGQLIEDPKGRVAIVSEAVDVLGLQELNYLKKLLFFGFLASAVITFSFGKIFSRQIFGPVRSIVKKVKGINAHNLDQRLPPATGKDEIADLTSTFNEMLDRLHLTFEMQNNFISNASHEFKTPLTVISGEAELAMELPDTSQNSKEVLEAIIAETVKLKRLIEGVLIMAQTGFDGRKQQWEIIRIDELMMSVKKNVDKVYANNAVHIQYLNPPDDTDQLCVDGNLDLLRSAVMNIVLNACKYSDNAPVQVTIQVVASQVVVEVQDSGIGIPEGELSQIFVPFFRASNTHKYQGHGLGLPLANNIVKMHHGHLNVKSKVDEGTMVVIYLPVAAAEG